MTPAPADDGADGEPEAAPRRLPLGEGDALRRGGVLDSSSVQHVHSHTAHLRLCLTYWQRQFETRVRAESTFQAVKETIQVKKAAAEGRGGLALGICLGTIFARVGTDGFRNYLGVSAAVWDASGLLIIIASGATAVVFAIAWSIAKVQEAKLKPSFPTVLSIDEVIQLMGAPNDPPSPPRPDIDG